MQVAVRGGTGPPLGTHPALSFTYASNATIHASTKVTSCLNKSHKFLVTPNMRSCALVGFDNGASASERRPLNQVPSSSMTCTSRRSSSIFFRHMTHGTLQPNSISEVRKRYTMTWRPCFRRIQVACACRWTPCFTASAINAPINRRSAQQVCVFL